jgi:SAM-dependent methyltransferase
MWWWDKAHPLAVYMDKRTAPVGSAGDKNPNWSCDPDVLGDFRSMPFDDCAFRLVVFDPPHMVRDEPKGDIGMKYGALPAATADDDLRRGFAECWRVLAPGGTLVFKWAESLDRVRPHFPAVPIVGTRSPRNGQTQWFIFYKPVSG